MVNRSPENLLTSGKMMLVVLKAAPTFAMVAPESGILLSKYESNNADSLALYVSFFSITLN